MPAARSSTGAISRLRFHLVKTMRVLGLHVFQDDSPRQTDGWAGACHDG